MLDCIVLTVAALTPLPQGTSISGVTPPSVVRGNVAAPGGGSGTPGTPGTTICPVGVPEREYNDSRGFADPVEPGIVVGELADADDVDCYRIDLSYPAELWASLTAHGASPARSPVLTLHDRDHAVVTRAAGAAFPDGLPSVVATLPPGTYFLECRVGQPNGQGSYSLQIDTAPADNLRTLPAQGTLTGMLSDGGTETLAFALGTDSRLELRKTSGAFDMFLDLRSVTGASCVRVEGTTAAEPALDVALPAGVWILEVGASDGTTGAYGLDVATTPAAFPRLACGVPVPVALAHAGSRSLCDLSLPVATTVTLTLEDTDPSDAGDGVIVVYDDRMRRIAHVEGASAGGLTTLRTPLPAGDYRVGVHAHDGEPATFELELGCEPFPFLPTIRAGIHGGDLADGDHAAWDLVVRTPAPYDISLRGSGPTPLVNGTIALIDATNGRHVGFAATPESGTARVGAMLERGRYLVVVRDAASVGRTFDLTIDAPIRFEDPTGPRSVAGLAKHGDLLATWVSAVEVAPTPVLPGAIDGFLQIDLGSAILVDARLVPVDGRTTGLRLPDGIPCVVQGAVLPFRQLPARLTNLLR